ncbi:hypothetical protein TIFTF001_001331 [Ficus carica]|uniref:Uncharacterized protein n=1 Tax=Ficus carica TaxID=3494 RepID=A0AA87Z140_FICCA|nr:hypothetical protein TIFTF001_001331 [Ficus carica]
MSFEEEIGRRSRGGDWRRERGRGLRENEWWSHGRQRLEARENEGKAAEIGGEVERDRRER